LILERFGFYLQHSLSDLRANIYRTAFVLICISVGVAAVVSLQNLGVMIDDTLTGNVQKQNRGDIALSISDNSFVEVSDESQGRVEDEFPPEYRSGFVAGTVSVYQASPGFPYQALLNERMVTTLENWLGRNYEGDYEVTYNSVGGGDFIGIIFSFAPGSLIIHTDNDLSASQQTAIFVKAENYPFYAEVETSAGQSLQEALSDPRHIVLSEKTAARLDAEVGDTVTLQKLSGEFRVVGTVPDSTEIRNPFADIFLGVFGYFYINVDALSQFGTEEALYVTGLYVKLDDPSQTEAIADEIAADYPYLRLTTTGDILEQNEEITAVVDDILKAIGLLALLLGSIGIINTMQVIVRRRTLEIGVLKTIGLKGRQITLLFLVEALLLGGIGSLLGTLVGSVAIFAVRDVGRALLGQELEFALAVSPIVNGVIVGIIVTTMFGILPTVNAGRVRPNVVLRPKDDLIPRTGIIRSLVTLVISIIIASLVMALTVMNVMGLSFLISAAVVGAVFAVGFILIPVLWVSIWFVARVLPKFRRAELEIAKTEIRTAKTRNAVTLLALVIGIFALSSITLFADAFASLIDDLLTEVSGGRPVFVQVTNPAERQRAHEIITSNRDVEDYSIITSYNTSLVSITHGNGSIIDGDELREVGREDFDFENASPSESEANYEARYLLNEFSELATYNSDRIGYDSKDIIDGRGLQPSAEIPEMLIRRESWLDVYPIRMDDVITLRFGEDEDSPEIQFKVVGFLESSGDAIDITSDIFAFVLTDDIPQEIEPESVSYTLAMPSDRVVYLQREMQATPSVFIFDTRIISTVINAFVNQFAVLPIIFGVVGLIVGAVVIANSVALSTLERRRDIAVLKAIGLKRYGVLAMILLENAILGFVGALLGVGFGVIALVSFDYWQKEIEIDINWTIVVGMTFLSMGIAVVAALVASWNTSGEKPLNVLRYD
jgi:ABC-type antimicrobial peptide transport system permease subunit